MAPRPRQALLALPWLCASQPACVVAPPPTRSSAASPTELDGVGPPASTAASDAYTHVWAARARPLFLRPRSSPPPPLAPPQAPRSVAPPSLSVVPLAHALQKQRALLLPPCPTRGEEPVPRAARRMHMLRTGGMPLVLALCRHSARSCSAKRRCRARRGACACCRQAACRWLVHCRHSAHFCCHHGPLAARRRWRTHCNAGAAYTAAPARLGSTARSWLRSASGAQGTHEGITYTFEAVLDTTAAARGTRTLAARTSSMSAPATTRSPPPTASTTQPPALHLLFAGLWAHDSDGVVGRSSFLTYS